MVTPRLPILNLKVYPSSSITGTDIVKSKQESYIAYSIKQTFEID